MTTTTASPETRRRSIWSWLLIVLVTFFVVAGAFIAVGFLTRDTDTEQTTFGAADVSMLSVDIESGDVTMMAEDRTDILVETEMTSTFWSDAEAVMTKQGDRITLEDDCAFLSFAGCEVDYTVRLPEDADIELVVEAAAGSIEIVGAGAPVDARTTAGDVSLTRYEGTDASIETTAGNATFSGVEAPENLRVVTTAGSVGIEVPDDVYRIDTETTVGDVDIEVRQDPDSTRTIYAETTAGDITISIG